MFKIITRTLAVTADIIVLSSRCKDFKSQNKGCHLPLGFGDTSYTFYSYEDNSSLCFFKIRAEILVHNSRNWDFTKIPNNMKERGKKSLHPHAKNIKQTSLARNYSGDMSSFITCSS